MKKLFLLLILSFFSAQSFAAGCPDGSEPVKSVSDDGTYFVFSCGVSNEQSSSNSNDSSSSSSVKAVKFESFVDTETSSSCKDLDTNFYRKSSNKCSIIAVLDRKPKFPGRHWFKNVWQTSELLVHRVNKDGNLEIVGKAENMGSMGIWMGLLAGLTASALMLYFRFNYLSHKLIANKPKEIKTETV